MNKSAYEGQNLSYLRHPLSSHSREYAVQSDWAEQGDRRLKERSQNMESVLFTSICHVQAALPWPDPSLRRRSCSCTSLEAPGEDSKPASVMRW